MVPTLTWGLSRSNLALATLVLLLVLQWVLFVFWTNPENLSFFRPTPMLGRRARELAHHPLGDVGRHLVVALELHRVGGAALGGGPQVGRVAEHLGQRHMRGDHLGVAALLHPGDVAAPAVEIADHVAHELL